MQILLVYIISFEEIFEKSLRYQIINLMIILMMISIRPNIIIIIF